MHIKDIPRVKGYGNYSVVVHLIRVDQAIDRYIKEDGLELNPDFQRGHVWTEAQQIAFVEFLLKGGKCPPVLFNHPGWMKSFEGGMVCVDGLQRITAIRKFLADDLAIFEGHTRSEIEGVDNRLRSFYLDFYINDLETKHDVLDWYLEINALGTPHTQEELERVRSLLEEMKEDV